MIRIDEVYNNTFWPYLKNNIPLTRMFFCDPPGKSDSESLLNCGDDIIESNYIFFHDQEPIHLDIHTPLFDAVESRNKDLNNWKGSDHKAIITSEWNSEFVDQVCSQYFWSHYYYFYHGWASLDWYRGYNKTFLIKPVANRNIQKTFIAPNRIVAGKRSHRLEMLYWIFKLDMLDNWISCPATCPVEKVGIFDAVKSLSTVYPDINNVFSQQRLPIQFPGEDNHPMHSCWLSLFDESAESLLYLVTETVAAGRRQHLTEKTFKPIALGMPFVIVGTQGCLKYLRSYGFKTFGDFWDESYDDEPNDHLRIEKIAHTLKKLDMLETKHKNDILHSAKEVIEHNWNHFYGGGFETVLWAELTTMLATIKNDFNV